MGVRMAQHWYVVHAYSGFEKQVMRSLQERIERSGFDEMFGEILNCIPLCNSVTKLSAMCSICKNGTLGSFSKRIINNNEKVYIGANNEYLSVCRKHYFIPSNDLDNLSN